MRKVFGCCVLILLAMVAGVQANILENPGFEDGPTGQITNVPIPGWSTWNYSGWHHDDIGAVIDTKAVKLWWTDSGIFQDISVTEGHTYRFSGYMLHTSGDPLRDPAGNPGAGDKTGELHAEWYDVAENLLLEETFGVITKDDPTDTWLYYSEDLTAPVNAVTGRILLRMYQPTAGDGAVNYDNALVYDVELYGQAYGPNPGDGAEIPLNVTTLSWQNQDPNNPSDVISCDIFFGTDPNFVNESSTATDITTGTVELSDLTPPVTLADGPTYYWRVDSTDPNTPGNPVTFTGKVWSFKVGDVPAMVNPDVNDTQNMQYTWVDEADADNDPATVSLMLSGSYTDDGKSPIIRAVYEQGGHDKAGATVVTIGAQTWIEAPDRLSGTVTAPVTITNPVAGQAANGAYRFWLNVEDSAGNAAEEATTIVYLTCIEAATNDPDDPMYQQWINGDLDGDCDTDLNDFAIIARDWATCMTPKASCTP